MDPLFYSLVIYCECTKDARQIWFHKEVILSGTVTFLSAPGIYRFIFSNDSVISIRSRSVRIHFVRNLARSSSNHQEFQPREQPARTLLRISSGRGQDKIANIICNYPIFLLRSVETSTTQLPSLSGRLLNRKSHGYVRCISILNFPGWLCVDS